MEVHKSLGWGLLEAVYQEALAFELDHIGIKYQKEIDLPVFYKGFELHKTYRMDLLVEDVIVELKAVSEILPEHRMQLFNYLRLTKKKYGLLINFGEQSLHCERYLLNSNDNTCYLLDKDLKVIY